jgi:flagellar protein FlaG
MLNNIGHSDITLKASSSTQLKLDTEKTIQENSLSRTYIELGHAGDISTKVNSNIDNNETKETSEIDFYNKVKETVDLANKEIKIFNTNLNFSIDKELNKVVVKVIDKETKEVVRQIPPEELLKMAKDFEKYGSFLFNKNV